MKSPEVVINQNPESQHIFGKENINAKRRQETYTDAVYGNIKKILVKSLCSQIVYQEVFGCANLVSAQMK